MLQRTRIAFVHSDRLEGLAFGLDTSGTGLGLWATIGERAAALLARVGNDGKLYPCPDVPRDLGLVLDEQGCIVIGKWDERPRE